MIMMMVVMVTHINIKERYDIGMLCHKTDDGMEKTHRMKVIDIVMIVLMIMMNH